MTSDGLLRAWRDVWPLGAMVLGLVLFLGPLSLPWKLAGAGILGLGWSRHGLKGGDLLRYLGGFLAFVAARAIVDDYGLPTRWNYPIAWDRFLFGEVPTVTLQRALLTPGHWDWFDYAMVTVYLTYFLMPPTVLVLLWRVWPHWLRQYVSATLALFAVSTLIHFLAPTAPPWLAAREGMLPGVTHLGAAVFGVVAPATYQYGVGISGNVVAAMPSVHLGVTTLMAAALWPTPLRWPAVLYVPLMGLAIVYGAEHYVVDGLAGIALGLVCWWWAAPRPTARARLSRDPRSAPRPGMHATQGRPGEYDAG